MRFFIALIMAGMMCMALVVEIVAPGVKNLQAKRVEPSNLQWN